MQTTHKSTEDFSRPAGNVVDLERFRRSRGDCGRAPEWDGLVWDRTGDEGLTRPVSAPWERRAWVLDVCASLGVLAMTGSFLLRALLL